MLFMYLILFEFEIRVARQEGGLTFLKGWAMVLGCFFKVFRS